jgi:hemagglutinin
MNKKTILTTFVLTAVTASTFAAGLDNTVNPTAAHYGAEAYGYTNTITATGRSAFVAGYNNTVSANNALVYGVGNKAEGINSLVGGEYSKATGRNSVAIGSSAEALQDNTFAIGSQARTNGEDALAFGNGAYSENKATVAIGKSVRATGKYSVAIGSGNKSEGESAVNIGSNNYGAYDHATIIGSENNITYNDHVLDPYGDIVVGTKNTIQNSYFSIAVGNNNNLNNADNAVVIGNNTSVSVAESVAIGNNSKAESVVGTSSANIGGTTYNFAGSTPVGTVSIGDISKERTLTNVAAGRISDISTDAVNGSQLHAVITEMESKNQNTLSQANHYTDTQVNKGVAKASALAGLKFLDYNPKDKWSFAASVGHYRNANAVAVGAAYQPNENTMIHSGITVDGKVAYNLGVSFKTGGQKYINKYKLQDQVRQLQSDNAELRQELNELRSMIEKK